MKITKTKLVEIIKEELDAVLAEEKEEKWQKPENLSKKELDAWEERYVLELDQIPEYVEDRHDEAEKKADEYIINLRSGKS